MSVKIMGLVWDLTAEKIEQNEKYVLLAYADHADHEGNNVFPSIALISKKTLYSIRQVQRLTRSLESKGFLVYEGSSNHRTRKWRINVFSDGQLAENDNLSPMTFEAGNATPTSPKGDITMSPESSVTTNEPSIPLSIENAIATGQPVGPKLFLQEQSEKEATHAFEKVFGFGKLPWFSTTVWTKLAKFITRIYQARREAFGDYVVWRGTTGKYVAFSNKKIRENPQMFMDTGWPEFEIQNRHSDAPPPNASADEFNQWKLKQVQEKYGVAHA